MKSMAMRFKLALQLAEVVDLTIGDDLDVAGLIQDRLLAAGEIDDRQPPHAEAHAGQRDAAFFIGTAMMQHLHPARELGGRDRLAEISFHDADNAAHYLGLFAITGDLCWYSGGDCKFRNLTDHD